VLEVNNLHIGYTKALFADSFSKSWRKGEVVVLLGDNGVGKSTFLKTLAGLVQPISGEVVSNFESIGWVDSSISKGVYLSVEDFLSFGVDSSSEEKEAWLSKFDLAIPWDRFLDELSDGQFRKLCVIRQLLKKPDVLFLDEPTVYFDMKSKLHLSDIIHELKKDCLIFCSTHDQHFADSIKTDLISF
tara:strand:- start:10741 stop:11301 length:561 start_codon:yes stop_codon:yes gene_type:complete